MSSPNKRTNSMTALSKFDRAQMLCQDIENIIEQEMVATPAMQATYESNIARIKKSKRKRPGLIRNYNTKKTRQVINNMEFDPETNTWIGNEDALGLFSPPQPALIVNRSRIDKEKVVGNMIWDPVEKIWKGNEKESRKFTAARKPALIAPGTLGSSAYLQKDTGMRFDPVHLRWVGNDNDLDVFAQIDKLADDGVAVGNEFHLSSPLTRSFVDCANRHKASLSGWFVNGGVDKNAHLYAIRNMSILRIVRDIKRRRTTYVDLDDSSADVPERDTSSPVGAVISGNGNSADATEDYDDLDLTGRTLSTKLRLPEVSGEWDKEFEAEPAPAPVVAKPKKNTEDDEGWDDVFGEGDADVLRSKLKNPSFTTSHVDVPYHGSIVDYSSVRKVHKAAKQLQASGDIEEDADGLELPAGSLHLLPPSKRAVHTADADALLEVGDPTNISPEPGFSDEDEGEDWGDVGIPSASKFPVSPVTATPYKSNNTNNNNNNSSGSQVIEEIDEEQELSFSGEALVLRRQTRVSDDEEDGFDSDEDMAVGLDIPPDFPLSLKR